MLLLILYIGSKIGWMGVNAGSSVQVIDRWRGDWKIDLYIVLLYYSLLAVTGA